MENSLTLTIDKITTLRGGVALVQHLHQAPETLYVETENKRVLYVLQELTTPHIAKYLRLGPYISGFPCDLFAVLYQTHVPTGIKKD